MDSRLVRAGILIVSLCAITVFFVVCAVNGVFIKDNKTPVPADEQIQTEIVSPVAEDGRIISADLYAWMEDGLFFDEEEPPVVEEVQEEKVQQKLVSYKVSTIDKDIRIVFLDEEGELLSGRKFKMDIEGLGEYTDTDRDGMIYVEDVKPGDYRLQMASMYGYAVPENPTRVAVKANIEYKVVADISYLIKTEDDIDASLEDTSVKESAGNIADEYEIKTLDGALFGIDVSKWNNEINWEKVKEAGVTFAIIRCGYRGSQTGAIVEDPYFRANVEGATAAGIPIGIYFFTQAVSEKEGIEEASAVISLIRDYKITYPIFIDTESAGGNGRADKLGVEDRTKAIEAFCETIRAGKYNAGVYASKNWFKGRLDVSKMSEKNVTWLAEYNDKPTYEGKYHMWQYTSAGRIPGIEGRVDMNMSYLDVYGKSVDKESSDNESLDNEATDKKNGNSSDKSLDKADSKNGSDEDSGDKKDKEQDENGQVDSRDM